MLRDGPVDVPPAQLAVERRALHRQRALEYRETAVTATGTVSAPVPVTVPATGKARLRLPNSMPASYRNSTVTATELHACHLGGKPNCTPDLRYLVIWVGNLTI